MTDRPDLVIEDGQHGLRITNLRKSYRRRPVIRDVSMSLDPGEVVALLGPINWSKCFLSR